MNVKDTKNTRPLVRGIEQLLKNRLFLATTFVPTVIATIYFGFLASNVYISESRFVVRSPERQGASPLGLILKGAGFSKAQDDSYTVQDYILSRDAIQALDAELKIKDAFSSSSIDIFSRFAPLNFYNSFEDFYPYYQRRVSVQLDSASSIATLTVRAYSPEMAYKLNQRLVELAEKLVNQLNERGREDLIRFATQEVADGERNARAAAMTLAAYRRDNDVIDPEKQSSLPLQQVAKIQEELISTKAQIQQLETLAKDNPQLPVLRQRASFLAQEIQAETKRITGGERSLAGKAAEFQRLILEREFADKMLASAMSTLEQARNEAQRKQLYLERVVQPIQPDEAMEPRRIRMILAVFMLGIIAWGVLTMLVAGVREHQD